MLVCDPGDLLGTGISVLFEIAGLSVPVELKDVDPEAAVVELQPID